MSLQKRLQTAFEQAKDLERFRSSLVPPSPLMVDSTYTDVDRNTPPQHDNRRQFLARSLAAGGGNRDGDFIQW